MNQRIAQLKTMLPRIPEIASGLKKEAENSLCGPCPICGGTDRFVYKTDTERFWCRQCHEKSGDIIDFHRWLNGVTTSDLLKQYFPDNSQGQSRDDQWESILSQNTNKDPVYRLLCENRKISKTIVDRAFNEGKVRFSMHKDKSAVACAFASLNGNKDVSAVQYLTVDGSPFPSKDESKEPTNKEFRYGDSAGGACFFQAGADIETANTIILCEAVINALSCADCIPEACILAIGGSTFTKKVAALRRYRDAGKEIVCFFDNDKAGRKANQSVVKTLGVKTKSVEWPGNAPDGFDVNDLLKNGEHGAIVEMIKNVKPVKIERSIEIKQKKKKPGVTEVLVSLAMSNITSFFKDQIGTQFARFPVKNHLEHWPIASKQFRTWLQGLYFKAENKSAYSEAMQQSIITLETIAEHDDAVENNIITLHNRTCEHDNAIWYDLSSEQWQAVKVTKDGWNVADKPPPLFRRRPHQKPQVQPKPDGDISKLYPFLEGIEDPEHKKIVTLWLCACLIPEFPHPILVPYGDQGSGKTTLTKNCKSIVDPSLIGTLGMIGKQIDLVQTLSHHWLLSFDNLSSLSRDVQDVLCGAVTKTNYSKRQLFTDDEDIITSIHNCLILSGINYPATAPDLLDRCILIKLKRFSGGKNNKKDVDLAKEFRTALPDILGGMLDIISKAMQIKNKIELSRQPRMLDFAEWGCAIAENMDGWNAEIFMEAYQKNIKARNLETIAANPISSALMKFMENRDEWEGTAQELFDELDQIVPERERKQKIWPKTVNVFGRRLNVLKVNLNEAGLQIETEKTRSGRVISIVKNEVEKQDNFRIDEI